MCKIINEYKIYIVFFIILNFIQNQLLAQPSLEFSFGTGQLMPNSPRFPEVGQPSFSVGTSLAWATEHFTKGNWSDYRYPELRLSAQLQTSGNADVLGHTLSVCPNLGFRLWQKKGWKLSTCVGLGLAFQTRRYDQRNAPTNTAIGSHLNAYAMASLRLERALGERFALGLGIHLAHVSNSNYAQPNLGLNTPSGELSFRFRLGATPKTATDIPLVQDVLQYSRAFRPVLRLGMGISEKSLDGPKFRSWSAGAGVSKRLARWSRLSVGLEWLYSEGAEDFQRYTGANPGRERQNATRYSFWAAHEALFGRLGIVIEFGAYLNKHFEQRHPLSARIGAQWSLLGARAQRHELFAGVYVRTYFGLAEMVEGVLGYRL